jgi:hypothetical protein
VSSTDSSFCPDLLGVPMDQKLLDEIATAFGTGVAANAATAFFGYAAALLNARRKNWVRACVRSVKQEDLGLGDAELARIRPWLESFGVERVVDSEASGKLADEVCQQVLGSPGPDPRSLRIARVIWRVVLAELNRSERLEILTLLRVASGDATLAALLCGHRELLDDLRTTVDATNQAIIEAITGLGDRIAPELPLDRGAVAWPNETNNPFVLLNPRFRIAPFVSHESSLDELVDWCVDVRPLAFRVVSGRGGSGKTRLAVELCVQLEDLHWGVCGFLRRSPIDQTAVQALDGLQAARLIVVDYAESRVEEVRDLINGLAEGATPSAPVRVLAIVRRAGQPDPDPRIVFAHHQDRTASAALSTEERDLPIDLSRSGLSIADRTAVLDAARVAYGVSLPSAVDLSSHVYDRPLTILATAILEAAGLTTPQRDWQDLLRSLIDREQETHWPTPPAGVSRGLARRVVALGCLVGGQTEREFSETLTTVPPFDDASALERVELATWCAGLYPGPLYFNPLEPDLLAEQLIADELATESLVLPDFGRLTTSGLQRALVVCARMAPDRPQVARRIVAALDGDSLDRIVNRVVDATIVEGDHGLAGALTNLLVALPDLTLTVYSDYAIPDDVRLQQLRSALDRVQRSLPSDGPNPVLDLAGPELWSIRRLEELGDTEVALLRARELVAALDQVTDSASPELVSALVAFGHLLHASGDSRLGAAQYERAIEISRSRARRGHSEDLRTLASLLSDHASVVSESDTALALAHVNEAVDWWRRASARSLQETSVRLAATLGLQGALLAETRDPQTFRVARAAAREAVSIVRGIAAETGDFDETIARVLIQSSLVIGTWSVAEGSVSPLDLRHEARAIAVEAADAFHSLCQRAPSRYGPMYARAVGILAQRVGDDSGEAEEAGRLADQAIAALRPVVNAGDIECVLPFANVLVARAEIAGSRPQALALVDEAIQVLSGRTDEDCLVAMVNALRDRSLYGEGVNAADSDADMTRAVEIARDLVASDGERYRPVLLDALTTAQLQRSRTGADEEGYAEEAAELLRIVMRDT